jgi:hypothetical protein
MVGNMWPLNVSAIKGNNEAVKLYRLCLMLNCYVENVCNIHDQGIGS